MMTIGHRQKEEEQAAAERHGVEHKRQGGTEPDMKGPDLKRQLRTGYAKDKQPTVSGAHRPGISKQPHHLVKAGTGAECGSVWRPVQMCKGSPCGSYSTLVMSVHNN